MEDVVVPCRERMRLLKDYSELLRLYSDLVEETRQLISCGLESEVDLLRRKCRSTWEAVERARIAWHRHEADHNCMMFGLPTQASRPPKVD